MLGDSVIRMTTTTRPSPGASRRAAGREPRTERRERKTKAVSANRAKMGKFLHRSGKGVKGGGGVGKRRLWNMVQAAPLNTPLHIPQ